MWAMSSLSPSLATPLTVASGVSSEVKKKENFGLLEITVFYFSVLIGTSSHPKMGNH